MDEANFLPDECDLVMEGGITSGVVYPTFIAGLATRFRLRCIGGTSVGAIAAVAAAAAQFNRNRGLQLSKINSFTVLAELPAWLRDTSALGYSNLRTLFQPCPDLARHFGVVQASLNRKNARAAAGAFIAGMAREFPFGAVAGALVLIVLFLIVSVGAGLLPRALGVIACGLTGVVLGACADFAVSGWTGLKRNRLGICSGRRGNVDNPPALTEWQHEYVQKLAGLPSSEPLTFRALAASTPPIELALMTTGLSELRAHRLPYASRDLVFKLDDIKQLFPAEIVDWMVSHSLDRAGDLDDDDDDTNAPSERTRALLESHDPCYGKEGQQLFRMPAPQDLPVVFAARMSLSFPILLQAIPLYRMRYVPGPAGAKTGVSLKRIWFSDGGLTSNFPIHFFDGLLPLRPTFGVTLSNALPEGSPDDKRVFLPTNHRGGITEAYRDLDDGAGGVSPLAFFSALLKTIRTWRDEALKRTPGYRDRVVQIFHTKGEGGLNLDMPPAAIEAMSKSGALAARAIIARFLHPVYSENGWAEHRWIRMRSNAAVLQQTIGALAAALNSPALSPGYRQMWRADSDHGLGYKLAASQQADGAAFWDALAAADIPGAARLHPGGPLALTTLTITPRQTRARHKPCIFLSCCIKGTTSQRCADKVAPFCAIHI